MDLDFFHIKHAPRTQQSIISNKERNRSIVF